MLGKAKGIKTTDCFKGIEPLNEWFRNNSDEDVLQVLVVTTDGTDYFYVVYKEAAPDAQ